VGDMESPLYAIDKPKGMDSRDFNRRINILIECEAVIMREILSIKTGLK
jgi:hypothetical protein